MRVDQRRQSANPSRIDWVLLATTLLLVSFGVVMVLSSSAYFAAKHVNDKYFFFSRQLIFAIVGFVVMYGVSKFNFENYRNRKFLYPVLGLLVLMLIMVFIPQAAGEAVLGAKRSLPLGPFHLQPSELAKPLVIMYLAFSLTKERERKDGFVFGFLIHLVLPMFILVLIVLEPDFGTFFLIFTVSIFMLIVAGSPIKYPLIAVVALTPAVIALFYLHPHTLKRLGMWMNQLLFIGSNADYNLLTYQVRESLISFGSGGFWGLGLAEGTLKMFFLPQAHSDFILATLGQELGFIGTGLYFLLFGVLVVRGYQIALRVPSTFGCFLAFGLTSLLLLQFMINSGVVMGILPPKGIALPMISYGGSSLFATLISIGILMNISKYTVVSDNGKRRRR